MWLGLDGISIHQTQHVKPGYIHQQSPSCFLQPQVESIVGKCVGILLRVVSYADHMQCRTSLKLSGMKYQLKMLNSLSLICIELKILKILDKILFGFHNFRVGTDMFAMFFVLSFGKSAKKTPNFARIANRNLYTCVANKSLNFC